MSQTETPHRRGAYEGTVLKLLRDGGPTSRSRLSAMTGLSPTTITKTVAPMVEAGLLVERIEDSGGLGRPAVTLIPVPEAVTIAGVQLGVGRVRLGLTDARGHVRAARSYEIDPAWTPVQVFDAVADELAAMLAADSGAPCSGIGVGAPGPVDAERRTNLLSINLGWRDVPISDLLEARLGIPTVVDHNVRSFALGEARYGDHDAASVAYVYVRTGVGFGVAVRGESFSGGKGAGGESYLGHLRAVEHGALCSCGARGCLETVVAEPYIAEKLKAMGGRLPHGGEMLPELHRLVEAGKPEAAVLETTVVEHLATAVATVVNLFTPELVLLGGALSALPDDVFKRLDRVTRERVFPLLRDSLRVETAAGGDDALIRGAAAVALEVLHYA